MKMGCLSPYKAAVSAGMRLNLRRWAGPTLVTLVTGWSDPGYFLLRWLLRRMYVRPGTWSCPQGFALGPVPKDFCPGTLPISEPRTRHWYEHLWPENVLVLTSRRRFVLSFRRHGRELTI